MNEPTFERPGHFSDVREDRRSMSKAERMKAQERCHEFAGAIADKRERLLALEKELSDKNERYLRLPVKFDAKQYALSEKLLRQIDDLEEVLAKERATLQKLKAAFEVARRKLEAMSGD